MRKNKTISALLKIGMLLLLITGSKFSQGQACNPFWDKTKSSNCENSPIFFVANSPGKDVYAWDFGNGGTSTQRDPFYAYSKAGTYTVTYTFTNSVTGVKCTGSFDIVIKASPRVFTRPLHNKNQCFLGNKFCFIDSTKAANPGKILKTKYLFSDGALYVLTNPKGGDTICHSVIDPAGGYFDLTIESEDSNGCITKVKYDTFIRVFPKIGVNFTASGPNACIQSVATIRNLTPAFTPLSSIKSFVWNYGFPGSFNNIITGSGSLGINTQWWMGPTGNGVHTHTYNVTGMPSGTYVFNGKLTVTTIHGCVDSFTFKAAATISILNVKIIADPDSSCSSTPLVEYTAVDRNTLQPISSSNFLWNFGRPPAGPANFNNRTLIKAAHNYPLGPWMASVNIRSGPCNVTVFDTITKIGPTSTIEIPFNRVKEDEKYQCVIRDSVHFVNNSSFYHVDDVPVFEDSSRVFTYFTSASRNKVGYWEKPLTLDTIQPFGTYQGKYGITTILYLDKDTLETLSLTANEKDSIIYYINGKKVRKAIINPIISGKDTIIFSKVKEYAFRWPGDQTAIPSVFPPARQRHKEHALRLWTFGDNYAPKCTTDTRKNKNVGLNCNFSRDSLPVHWYTPWEQLYKNYNNGQFYATAAEKTVLCKGGRYCYKIRYYPANSFVIPADTLVIVPQDSTMVFFGKDTIKPSTPEKFTGSFRIKKVPTYIAGMGSYVPTLSDEKWFLQTPDSITVKNIRTGVYTNQPNGMVTLRNMTDQMQLEPERQWRTYTLTSSRPVVYLKLWHMHDEPLHGYSLRPYKVGTIPGGGTYVGDTSTVENWGVRENSKITKQKVNADLGKVTRFFLEKDTLETFYQKYGDADSIIYYVNGQKVKRPISNPIKSGNDVLNISEYRIIADTAFSRSQFYITAGRTINAQPTTICVDTIIGGRDTFVTRSRIYIDSNFHRENFYFNTAQCNTVSLYHEDTVHSLRCKSQGQISLALVPPNGRGLKWEGIKCYAPPSPPYGMIFDVGETKPGCTQRLLKFNFDSAGGTNNWVTHGGFLSPPLPGAQPWHPGYQPAGAYPTRFVMPYTAGQIQNRNPGWVTVGVIIGNGRWMDYAAPLDTIECIDTTWYHNAFRYLYLDSRFTVIVPERTQKTVCVGDTITFQLVDPKMDSVTQLVWNWNDDQGSYYEERTYYYKPYPGPNNNRNDRVIKDWKKGDKWLYSYVIRLEYDGFNYKTLDTIVTGIIRKWTIAADVTRAGVALENAFKALNLVMSEIPSTEIPLYFGNGSGKGCIDTTGLGSLISYGVAPYRDALTSRTTLVRLKSKLAPFADSVVKSKIAPFRDSMLVYMKSKVNTLKDSVATVGFKVGDTWYRYTDYTKKDSVIISQKLHWRDSSQAGWDTLKHRVKTASKVCPFGDSTIKSRKAFFRDSLITKSRVRVYRDSVIKAKSFTFLDSTIVSFIYKDSTVKKKLFNPKPLILGSKFSWFWWWRKVSDDSIITVKSKLPPYGDSAIKSNVKTYVYTKTKSKIKVYRDSVIRSKSFILYDSMIKSKVPTYGDSLRANKLTNLAATPGVYRHAYTKASRYFPTFQLRNTEGCFQPRNTEVVVGFFSNWTFSDSIICHGNTDIVLRDSIRYFAYQDPFNWLNGTRYWNTPTRFVNNRERMKIDWNEHNDSIKKSKLPPYCDSIAYPNNLFGTTGIGVPPFKWHYDDPGIYTVRIAMKDSMGCVDTTRQKIYVTGVKAGIKVINASTNPCKNIFSFLDTSKVIDPCLLAKGKPCDNIVEYTWDFGDGKRKSKLQNPSHDYTQNGDFTITLKVRTKLGCEDSTSVKIHIEGPRPHFDHLGDTVVCVNDSVSFINNSWDPPNPTGWNPKWIWDFGDLSTYSDTTKKSVGHRYKNPGTYYVYLTQFANIQGDPNKRCSVIYPDTTADFDIPVRRIIRVKAVAPAEFDILPNDTICPNTLLNFSSVSDTLYKRFTWLFGTEDTVNTTDTFASYRFTNVGKYKVTMIPDYDTPEFHKCLDTVSHDVVVLDVKADFTVDDTKSPLFCFVNASQGAVKYEWIFEDNPNGSSILKDPCYQWPDTGCHLVTLIATNAIGCTDTAYQEVCSTFVAVIIPYNVFTPEPKDGLNDLFRVKAQGLDKFDITIYNRWGEVVFESQDSKFGWNGKVKNDGADCPEGTYFYIMNYQVKGKPLNDGRKKPMSGTVTLLRGK